MLDAMAMVLAGRFLDSVFVGAERHVEGPVADGVHAAAQAGVVALLDGVVQFVLLNSDDTVIMLVVFIRIVEAGVAASDTAVDTHFYAADAQPVVAKTGSQTELDQALGSDHRLDHARQQAHAGVHAAFFVNFLIGTHRFGITDNVVNSSYTAFETLIQRVDDAVLELKVIKFGCDLLENQLGSFVELSRRLAGLRIVFNMSSGRVGSVTSYFRCRQLETVADRDMGSE